MERKIDDKTKNSTKNTTKKTNNNTKTYTSQYNIILHNIINSKIYKGKKHKIPIKFTNKKLQHKILDDKKNVTCHS